MQSIFKVLVAAILVKPLLAFGAGPKVEVKVNDCAAQFYNAHTHLLVNTVAVPNACVSSEAYFMPGGKVLLGSTPLHDSAVCGGRNVTCAFLVVANNDGSDPQFIQVNQPERSRGPLEDYKFMNFAPGPNGEILALRQQSYIPICTRMHLDAKTFKSLGVEPVTCADWLPNQRQLPQMSYACPNLAGNYDGTESVANGSQAIVHVKIKNKVADGFYNYSFQGGSYFSDALNSGSQKPMVAEFIADGQIHKVGDKTDKASGLVLSNMKYRVACSGNLVHFEMAYTRALKNIDAGAVTHKVLRFMDVYSEDSQLVINMTDSVTASDGTQAVSSTVHKLQPQKKSGH